jgi:hypothetical protein
MNKTDGAIRRTSRRKFREWHADYEEKCKELADAVDARDTLERANTKLRHQVTEQAQYIAALEGAARTITEHRKRPKKRGKRRGA